MIQTKRRPLTARQRTILAFLEEWFDTRSLPPSVRDVQNGCDISSTSVVVYNLTILQEKGYIRKQDGLSRSVTLLGDDNSPTKKATCVPIVDEIHHDKPFRFPSMWDEARDCPYITVPRSHIAPRLAAGAVAVKVGSPSFDDALLREGDVLILVSRQKVGDGAVALMEVNNRVTGKFERMSIGRVYLREFLTIDLKPLSPICNTTRHRITDVLVRAVVLGVLRSETACPTHGYSEV